MASFGGYLKCHKEGRGQAGLCFPELFCALAALPPLQTLWRAANASTMLMQAPAARGATRERPRGRSR